MAGRVSPRDVKEGERYVMHWRPYGWAQEADGYTSPVTVVVEDVAGTRRQGHMQDIKLRFFEGGRDGATVTHHVDNGYVTGQTSNPDVPPATDVGRFSKYEKARRTTEEQRRDATRGGARYGGAGSVPDARGEGTVDHEFDFGGGL